MVNNTEYREQFADLEELYYQSIESGLETCPCCGREVPHNKMTASVSRGVICQDCDLTLSN